MRPYYDEGGITIYHGDCRDVLPTLALFDMIFTSPPYNLSAGGGLASIKAGHSKWNGAALAAGYDACEDALPPAEYDEWQRHVLALCWERLTTTGAIFYNHKPLLRGGELWTPLDVNPDLPVRQIVTWARAGGINFGITHYVPTYEWIVIFAKPAWRLKSQGASGVGDLWRVPQEANTNHPAPFPIGLPARAIESAGPEFILDPFMGSGTTLRAAKDAGIRAIGIEKSERYCEIAARRLAQGVLAL